MKHIKRLFSTLLVLALALTFAVPAFAVTPPATTDVTMNDTDEGSTYAAYKLFTAKYVRTDTIDGEPVDVYEYHLNETYAAAIKAGMDAVDSGNGIEVTAANEAKVLEFLKNLTEGDTKSEIRTFADAVYKKIQADGTAATATANGKTFEDLEGGYYLIAETTSTGEYSLVMLNTVGKEGTLTVTTKEDAPEAQKKVIETNDTTGNTSAPQDGADYDINDPVPFVLTATVSEKYDGFEKFYYLAFHDVMETGLDFDKESLHVYVKAKGSETETELTNPAEGDAYYKVVSPTTDGHTFDVVFENLKKVPGVNAGDTIIVKFNAKLNENAVIGKNGNHNTSHIEYSNNPYKEEDHGHTPDDKVVVFTFEVDVNKLDGNRNALDGAGFTLYKWVKGATADSDDENAESEVQGTEAGAWVKVKEVATGTKFEFKGVDSGLYRLVETTVPKGYNKADDVFFEVAATYDTEKDDPQLLTLAVKDMEGTVLSDGTEGAVFTADMNTGLMSTNIVNLTGAELPSTGGMGTTLFYIVGGILVAAAVILLVTKKRVNSDK